MNEDQSGWTKEMQGPLTKATEDGIIEGIKAFFSRHNLSVEPGTLHTNPLHEVVLRFTAEMQDPDDNRPYKRIYPFKNSFRDPWQSMIVERTPIMRALWDNKENKEAIALARTLSYLETFKFLEDNHEEIIAEYHRIRGGDLVAEVSE